MESETKQEPVEMGLCEVKHTYLRPNVLYIFRELEGCEECKRLAQIYRDPPFNET